MKFIIFVNQERFQNGVFPRMLENIKSRFQIDDQDIQVYDIQKDVDKTTEYKIFAAPTIIRVDKNPPRRIIGNLEDLNTISAFFGGP